jgi:hypothetical protein
MYASLLAIHNVSRWLVLIAAAVALVVAVRGLVTRRPWDRTARLSSLSFVSLMDLQLVLGLLLYVVSPIVRAGLSDMAVAMADTQIRFFVVEHLSIMIVAVVFAHVGSVTARRAPDHRSRYARTALWFGLSTIAVLVAIPWWRPLFPGL